MPRLEHNFGGDAFADGAGDDHYLIDVSAGLSRLYGRLIRQGQVFKINSIDVRLVNPNTSIQDEVMAVSGKFIYFHPTSGRTRAWKTAKDSVLSHRKTMGLRSPPGYYDFRVGLFKGWGAKTDAGVQLDGVAYNAWINSDSDYLVLNGGGDTDIDIFGNHNDNLGTRSGLENPTGGFGHWAMKDAASIADELDFVRDEYVFFRPGEASLFTSSVPFQVSFTSVFASQTGASEAANSVTTADRCDGPIYAMCGLIGVKVDTTTVDDSAAQTADWEIEISVDVESWSPLQKKKSRRKRSKR